MEYVVCIDQTYKLNGERKEVSFDNETDAVDLYTETRFGFVSITKKTENKKSILLDESGRKYIKGSPFYIFPHVPHISIIDGREIETT